MSLSNETTLIPGASESIVAVHFSFYTDEEVKKISVKKITNPVLLDGVGSPVPSGLYDPALGPMDDRSLCKTCGQSSLNCTGHCGHIELVSPTYNPLLFNLLFSLLQRACFYCRHFRIGGESVEKLASQLELVVKGDIVGAKELLDQCVYSEDRDVSHVSFPKVSSGETHLNSGQLKHQTWTSLQLTEAKSIMYEFMKRMPKICKHCTAKNPKIIKPNFGWFHTTGMDSSATRANVIRGIQESFTDGIEENPSYDADDGDNGFPEHDIINIVNKKISTSQSLAEFYKQKDFFSRPLLPSMVRDIIKGLWENEARFCSLISDLHQEKIGSTTGYSMFFLETLLVPSIKCRPPARAGDSVMEHPQTVLLAKVVQCNHFLGNAHSKKLGSTIVVRQWRNLQDSINFLYDSKAAAGGGKKDLGTGICQLLEKKDGIFRQKMMGKRVNYACRSVISPDPYLAVDEIGIPPYFALRLTYPERVTYWNVGKLREGIINGPDTHPGATHYIDKSSTMKLSYQKKSRISISRRLPSSRGAVTQSGGNDDCAFDGKIVYRHLQDGDIVLVNRQPTLHKPSIMAHKVRVLKGEKTLRMHYSNCSTYNADFDGDEMNVHFPQDEICRAEGYNLVHANNQYIVPTRGDAKRGLIQDHIVSAVLLTKKDTFLTCEQYNQLLYSSGISSSGSCTFFSNPGRKITVVDNEVGIQPLLPAVWKPSPRWTGKQVITTVLNHLTRGRSPFTVDKDSKIPRQYFGNETGEGKPKKKKPDESTFLILKNELVHGVIDQAQFSNYGLVHTVQELYGSNTAGVLLSVFSRLFTIFLQMHGFTCGVDDLLILKSYDNDRKKKLDAAGNIGEEVHSDFLGFEKKKIDPVQFQLEIEKFIQIHGDNGTALLDRKMSSDLSQRTSDINQKLLHEGLYKPFPRNCISLMTTSGAKGSMVNFSQISSFLGQQALEGKRVPRMVSGKTLPCFPAWDHTSRAGGFISDCFLTGLRPQEYYFHCMAGREGLVDTAVKTSRSGYLQRCLIKNMESLKVEYDYTVRDADSSIVQFAYGEDGVDVHQINFLNEHKAMAANQESFHEKFGLIVGDPYNSEIDRDIQNLPFVKCLSEEGEDLEIVSKKTMNSLPSEKRADLFNLVKHKYFSSLAQPGEPVGVIAGQSVGEPSTQMTLNTFHLAGRGEVNVTLGIPRLQEILMMASSNIDTPIMTCPLPKDKTKKDGLHLAAKLKKVLLADIIESIQVSDMPISLHGQSISMVYILKLSLVDPKLYPLHSNISVKSVKRILKVRFMRELEDTIQSHLALRSRISGIKNFIPDSQPSSSADEDDSGNAFQQNDDDEDDDDGETETDDIGLDAEKRKRQGNDEYDYEDGSENEADDDKDDHETGDEGKIGNSDNDPEASGGTKSPAVSPKSKSINKVTKSDSKGFSGKSAKSKSADKKIKSGGNGKDKGERIRKEFDRSTYEAMNGLVFEAHFKFTNEPHVLLGEIAQKAAKKVYIKNCGKVSRCEVIQCNEDQILTYDKDRVQGSIGEKRWALQTAGVDFHSFWEMEDDIDIGCIYSNNIHDMLNTYGVEAARATVVREVYNVFKSYGVAVNIRHLYLIGDFMTHCGGFRSMSRMGGIAGSISPFSKMTFETASKFIVEAASRGDTDNLETPSARVCLGLPVKMGTGSMELFQKLDV